MTRQNNPFRLNIRNNVMAKVIENALSLSPLAEKYDHRPADATPEEFLDYTMDSLSCSLSLDGCSLHSEIPEQGPVIVVANHPFGGIEGVMLTRALLAIRSDTRVLTNQMLSGIPELAPVFFGVDVLGEKTAHRNTASVRSAAKHLQSSGLLLVFPAGQVSSMSWRSKQVLDRQWNPMIGRLAQKYEATCVPVYVHGQNPFYFQVAGLIHPRLRTALLPRQLSNKVEQTIQMTVGQAINPSELRNLESAESVTDALRLSTYLLASTLSEVPHQAFENLPPTDQQNLKPGVIKALAELEDCKLISKGEFDVYCAPFDRLGDIFELLAIARETTFRAVGEGTGKEKDSDQYDPIYHHLFIWDREKQAIVGGYRLGETHKIIQQHGVKALYSRSLYRYDARYIQSLGSALEVGRSFVTPAYQRHSSALDLLWRGIGHFVVCNPQYRILFGCVSISSEHSEKARAFISDAMMESFRAEQKFLENVKPMIPLKVKGKVWSAKMLASIRDISVFNKLVGQCDPGKSIPVLLRHYLALNGRFVGFSVNKGFNDSLDGLILVDLHKMPTRYLTRYLGKEGSTAYLNYKDNHESTLHC
ncbi:MAG: GNAT family N-acyltransferase [Reinekea sp.]